MIDVPRPTTLRKAFQKLLKEGATVANGCPRCHGKAFTQRKKNPKFQTCADCGWTWRSP